MTEKDTDDLAELRRLVRKVIDSGPAGFEAHAERARGVRSAVHAEIASALGPVLNAHLNTLPQDTLVEKRDTAAWVNHELRQLGLAIRSPVSNIPGILIAAAGRSGDEREGSRFLIMSRDERGRKKHSPSSGWVPELELVEDPPRKEGRSRYRE